MSSHRKSTCHHHRDVTQKTTEVQPADGLWNYKPSPDPLADEGQATGGTTNQAVKMMAI